MIINIGETVYVTKSYIPKEVMRVNLEHNCFIATDWTLWSFSDIIWCEDEN